MFILFPSHENSLYTKINIYTFTKIILVLIIAENIYDINMYLRSYRTKFFMGLTLTV